MVLLIRKLDSRIWKEKETISKWFDEDASVGFSATITCMGVVADAQP